MESRRDFIKKLTALSGGLAISSLPGAVQRAFAINPDPGTTFMDAEHIVFLMQENRSFDHLLGTLQGVRGFNDPRFLRQENGNPIWLQSDATGKTYAPVRCDIKNTNVTWGGGCPHSVQDQINARNLGYMDKWIDVKTPNTMQYFTRKDHPFYHALADAFTVCDHYFCSSLTGTSPNRSMFWTGQLTGSNGLFPDIRDHMDNTPFLIPGASEWQTFPEVLQNNGISWKVYQNQTFVNLLRIDDVLDQIPNIDKRIKSGESLESYKADIQNFFEILMAPLKQMGDIASKVYTETDDLKVKWLSNFGDNVLESFKQYYPLLNAENRAIIGAEANAIWEALPQYNKDIHNRAFTTNIKDPLYNTLTEVTLSDGTSMKVPAGDILYQFRQDVTNGELPTVSWLCAPEVFSDHPVSPQYGPWYVSEVLDILTSKPEVWKKTIFIINFDENDGFFDHMPPFVAPADLMGKCSSGIDLSDELADDYDSPIGLGYRVPMLVVSPWSRGGWVNSQVFDHTSTLMFLEKFLQKKTGNNKITCDNISQFRRTVCGDLTSAFRPYSNEKITLPPLVAKLDFFTQIKSAKHNAAPGTNLLSPDQVAAVKKDVRNSQLLPKQEEGIRPGNGLLYQLFCEAKFNKSLNSVDISFEAGNEIYGYTCWGAAFNLYWGFGDLDLTNDPNGYKIPDINRPRSYVVKAGDKLKESLPMNLMSGNEYHITVYGPNGFSREFSGDNNDPDIDIFCLYQYALQDARALTGNVEILVNINDKIPNVQLIIIDNAYGQPDITVPLPANGGRGIQAITQLINLEKSLNWYDFTVRIPGNEKYYRRYTGHVETGLPGYTDPYMGRWDGSTKPPLM
ncbi:phosphocholine-specific phospholipase C [Taibaiella helva]|uniref:phosphocholine-specific phospholipase C n=1 Tax=Taibaiella helva TaxID=2301235 RepID=UPI000E57D0C6|nr:phospholipase C, phosphocholine-specific [Taibaiella helva]